MSAPRTYTKFDFGPAVGTAERRANLVAGGTVSRREYQRLIGAPLPKRDIHGERIDRKPVSLYTKTARRWAAEHGVSRKTARQDPELQRLWHHLRELWRAEQKGEVVDRSPEGDMAETMRELGMKHDTQYWVGETP